MTDDLSTRLLAAIAEKAQDAKDSKYRLECRVAFAIGQARGENEYTMAGGAVWDRLLDEARQVIADDIYPDPHDELLRLGEAHRPIVGLIRLGANISPRLGEAPTLRLLARGYGIEEGG